MGFLYELGSTLAFGAAAPFLKVWPRTRQGWGERLGGAAALEALRQAARGPRMWFHGASAGDVAALEPMIRLVRERLPRACLVVSTITNTGRAFAERRLAGVVDGLTFAPWDVPFAPRRAMEAFRPALVAFEYTELWPNWLEAARAVDARVVLTNGRLSPARLGMYRALFTVAGNALECFDALLMRGPDEAARALALGARPEVVQVTGSTKLDALPGVSAQAREVVRGALGAPARPLLVAGSIHAEEEGLALDWYQALQPRFEGLRLLVAPRYLERVPSLLSQAARRGLTAGLRSGGAPGAQVVVLDSIGELAAAYGLGAVALVGGSFNRRGGQNILEPAAQGVPTLCGPSMRNFEDALALLAGRGVLQVASPEDLLAPAARWLEAPDEARAFGALGPLALAGAQGASARNVEVMVSLLGQAAGEVRA